METFKLFSFFFHKDTGKLYKRRVLLLLVVVGLLVLLYMANYKKNKQLFLDRKNNTRYTVGKIWRYHAGARTAPTVEYTYYVNNFWYNGIQPYPPDFNDLPEGTLILVDFYTKNPRNSRIVTERGWFQSLPAPPPEGWPQLPN